MSFTAFQSNAFLNAGFQTIFQGVPDHAGDPGGRAGYYRRPIKYVRDGQVVDLNQTEEPTVDEIIGSFELTPQILAALTALLPGQPSPLPGMVGRLEAKLGHIMIERELASMNDDDAMLTAVTTDIILEGVMRVNGAGTIIPQVTFSAGPTGTCETALDSYFEIEPIGSNVVTAVGNWA